MMTLEQFREKMRNEIENATDGLSVLDLRASRSPYRATEDNEVFLLSEIDEAYEFVKDSDEWYVDVYENFELNKCKCAEYTGFSVASWEQRF